ncbi:MAG: DUF4249 domain-containing protein [Bacteroidota bacterium]|jgi:hypothetical protein
MRYFLLFTVVVCLLSACEKEVQIDIPGYKEQLVVDGRIQTDCYPIVLLSASKNIYAETDLSAYLQSFVYDASIEVNNGSMTVPLQLFSIQDLPAESQKLLAEMLSVELNELIFLPIQVYSTLDPSMKGEVGKTYELKIVHKESTYSGETTLYPTVQLDNLYWKPDPANPEYGFCWARLSDPSAEYNAYKWEAKRIKQTNTGEPYDMIFRRSSDPYFDDEFFNGLTFEFDTRYPERDTTYPENFRRHYKQGDSVVIRFSRIDRDVFEFFDKKDAQLGSAGNPFSTPVNIPSNIKGGALGIWAGISTGHDTLYCIE